MANLVSSKQLIQRALLIFLGGVVVLSTRAAPPAWKTISVQDLDTHGTDSNIELKLTEFDPPVILDDAKWPVKAGEKPFWFTPFYAFFHFGEFTYSNYCGLMSSEMLRSGLLSERKFEKLKADYAKNTRIPVHISLVWQIEARFSGRQLVFVVSDPFEVLSILPRDNVHLRSFSVLAFEYMNGVWKNQELKSTGIASKIPFPNRIAIEDIIEIGHARLQYGVLLAPGKQ